MHEALWKPLSINWSIPTPDKEKQKKLFPYSDGMNHYWMHSPEIYCHVAVLDEAGKLDLNYSNEPTLERLLGNIGVDPRLSVLLAKSIMKWRGQESSPGAVAEKPRQFRSVEELLLVEGMTREILYGDPRRNLNGNAGLGRGLAEYVTVYTGTPQININYAEPEAIAALPGMDMDIANSIVHAREKGDDQEHERPVSADYCLDTGGDSASAFQHHLGNLQYRGYGLFEEFKGSPKRQSGGQVR